MRIPARGRKPRKAQPVSFPAPTGGLIANRSLAIGRAPNLPPGASVLDNWFPTSTGVLLRRGRELRFSIGSGPVNSMFRYVSGAQEKLFASTDGDVFDITTSTPAVAWDTDTSNGDWNTQQFTTAAGTFLIGVNGVDPAWIYNGTTFAATTITFPIGSPLDTSDLVFVWSYAKRLWFIQRDSMSAWYLPVDQIGGELKELPLGSSFTMGGVLLWGQSWSLTSGGQGGLSDQVVFVSTEGEVLVYQGNNPDSADGFAKVGLYRIGDPMGRKAWLRSGGDLLVATSVGLISLAKAASSDLAALGALAASYPIEELWQGAIQQRGMIDWRCMVWAEGRMVIVAPPRLPGQDPVSLVANSGTGAWCRYTNWDIKSMEVFAGQMQFGDRSGNIWRANVTGQDDGAPFTAVCVPLYEDMGAPANRKIARMGRVIKRSMFKTKEKLTAMFDFSSTIPPAPNATSDTTGGVWGVGVWGTDVWGEDAAQIVTTEWRSLGGSGQDVSVCLQVTSGDVRPLDAEIIRVDATIETGEVVS